MVVQQREPEGQRIEERRGLVSRRVEMFSQPQKAYHHRPQDSFAIKTPVKQAPAVVETREETPSAEREQPSEQPTRPSVGSALIAGGIRHYDEGEYEQAQKAFRTALKTQRVSTGDEDVSIALTLSNIGAVHLQQGNLDEAEEALKTSLVIKKRLAPDAIVADILNNLGNCANLRGDYEGSLNYYRESLNDLRQKRGRRGDVANALFNIGRLEIQTQQWETAVKVLAQAYRMNREVYGKEHEYVAQTLEMVGFVHLQTRNYDTAMTSFTSALGIYRKANGPGLHTDIAKSMFNIGMVSEATGDLSDAWETYTTSRDIYARLGTSQDDPDVVMVLRSISNIELAITKQTQAHLVAKHHQAKDLLNATKKKPSMSKK